MSILKHSLNAKSPSNMVVKLRKVKYILPTFGEDFQNICIRSKLAFYNDAVPQDCC